MAGRVKGGGSAPDKDMNGTGASKGSGPGYNDLKGRGRPDNVRPGAGDTHGMKSGGAGFMKKGKDRC